MAFMNLCVHGLHRNVCDFSKSSLSLLTFAHGWLVTTSILYSSVGSTVTPTSLLHDSLKRLLYSLSFPCRSVWGSIYAIILAVVHPSAASVVLSI